MFTLINHMSNQNKRQLVQKCIALRVVYMKTAIKWNIAITPCAARASNRDLFPRTAIFWLRDHVADPFMPYLSIPRKMPALAKRLAPATSIVVSAPD